MKIALLLAAVMAAPASAGSVYKCESTHLNSPEFPKSQAALLVQDDGLVLSDGSEITKMPIISDGLIFEIYEVSHQSLAVLWPRSGDMQLQILHPKSGSAPRIQSYICRPE